MGRITSYEPVGITRGIECPHLIHCRLYGKFLPGSEFILPFFSNADDNSGKFVTNHCWVYMNVVRNTFVVGSLDGCLVRRHADTVGNNLCKYLIFFNIGQIKLLQTKIFLSVNPYCFCLHRKFLFILFFIRKVIVIS